MIKIYNEDEAKKIWDSTILNLSNPTFYQSYNYSKMCKDDKKVDYICEKDKLNCVKIMCFIKIYNDKVSIPFGPIFSSNVTIEEIMYFIEKIRNHYNRSVVFSLPDELITESLLKNNYLEKGWHFVTPLVNTECSIDEIVKNCNENRRRIIKKVLQTIPQNSIRTGLEFADEYIKLYEKRMKETNNNIDLTLNYLNNALNYNNTKLTVCLHDNKIIAGSVTFEYGDTLITRYNCYDFDYSRNSPIARVDYELLKYASENPNIRFFDMSGLAVDENISEKENNLNRYKLSYKPQKKLSYQYIKRL